MSNVTDKCRSAGNIKPEEGCEGEKSSTSPSQSSPVVHMSLAQLNSIIGPFSRPKFDAFTEDEIKLLLDEIGKHRHILLTYPRKNSRAMKAAWDDVARSVALRSTRDRKRSAKQLKRKWKDIVGKTRKKIREGQLKQEMEFNEITAMVMQFLASTSHEMQQETPVAMDSDDQASPFVPMQSNQYDFYYDGPDSSGVQETADTNRESNGDDGSQGPPPQDAHSFAANSELSNGDIDRVVHTPDSDVVLVSHSTMNGMTLNADIPGAEPDADAEPVGDSLQAELLRQSRAEHVLRMEVLEMKRRYWQFRIEALEQERRHSPVDQKQYM